ncbi:uncharacterized protein [Miscanthus floridulus]|uniref:uncharacterized protein isoform X2 n=1 Tax=Miscanthus floridulus TaxID=154761 RepID=UPI00345A42ED
MGSPPAAVPPARPNPAHRPLRHGRPTVAALPQALPLPAWQPSQAPAAAVPRRRPGRFRTLDLVLPDAMGPAQYAGGLSPPVPPNAVARIASHINLRCLMHCLRGRPSAIFKVFAEKVPVIEVCSSIPEIHWLLQGTALFPLFSRPILYLAMQLFVFECLLGCLITWTTSSREITSCDGTCRLSHYSMKWMAAGETVTSDGSRLRGSKRL